MPNDKTLSEAVFKSITETSYPEDNVVSSELSASALQSLSESLEKARVDVKTSISELSRLSATDIDGWISQAKQLRSDIAESQKKSQDIVTFAAQGEELRGRAKDAASKVSFLGNETNFNDSLVTTLKSVQELKQTTDFAQQALQKNDLLRATSLLNESKKRLGVLRGCERTRLIDVINGRLEDLRSAVSAKLIESWNSIVVLDSARSSLSIYRSIEGEVEKNSLETIVQGLAALDLLQARIYAFRKDFDGILLQPCLQRHPTGLIQSLKVVEQSLRLTQEPGNKAPGAFFADLHEALGYLNARLPRPVLLPLAESLAPNLISRLLSGPLMSAVPTEIDALPGFQNTLSKVTEFGELLHSQGWQGHKELQKWVRDAPQVWLLRRSQSSLHSIRQILKRGLGSSRSVERIETQKVSSQDEIFADTNKQDDWDAGWSDDEKEPAQPTASATNTTSPTNGTRIDYDDDDVSGWGFNEDEEGKEVKTTNDASNQNDTGQTEEDEGDAWGWGDENENQENAVPSPQRTPARPQASHNGQSRTKDKKPGSSDREITLRETYHITALPEQILEIITMAVEDADTLAHANRSTNPIASASTGLYSLPGHLLSMFRASAPNFYSTDPNGNMFLYNDCLYISEQLRSFAQYHLSRNQDAEKHLRLDDDIAALELFGKRSYGREMESQRTILTDLLDGAQGFANCTESPFAQECETAISSTTERIRDLHHQWSSVLSRSALLQSIGSLLVTVTNKIIVDIEDMSDISEPESQRLTSFCNRITGLDDLFLPEQAPGTDSDQQPIPLTAGYTSTWLKFQYLSNILESSLVDIKYLWTEGELSLEFSGDEVVDLIEALFADSDYRRKAIHEIKRGPAR